jgi:hypothetical protein
MAQAGEAALMMGAPEVGIPMEFAKQLAPHAPTIMMFPFIGLAILLILIGIITFSVSRSKTPGIMLFVVGLLLGGGAFTVMRSTERRNRN